MNDLHWCHDRCAFKKLLSKVDKVTLIGVANQGIPFKTSRMNGIWINLTTRSVGSSVPKSNVFVRTATNPNIPPENKKII